MFQRLPKGITKKVYNNTIIIDILVYQILAFTLHGEIWKSHTKTISLKYQLRCSRLFWVYHQKIWNSHW